MSLFVEAPEMKICMLSLSMIGLTRGKNLVAVGSKSGSPFEIMLFGFDVFLFFLAWLGY